MDRDQSKITFESDEWQFPARAPQPPKPSAVQWIIRYSGGYIRDEDQATYVLLGFVAASIPIMLWLFAGLGGAKPPTDAQVRQIIENQRGARAPSQ